MNGFAVDPAELRALARPLVRVAGDVADLSGHPEGQVDPARGELFAALTRFRAAADHATDVLVRDVGETDARLADTARHYEEADVFPA
ncbi:hypothetical protein UK23_13955 [Lentzea aerocolonigenes]|uniref:Uncharacterized protein n=1 Tax=Lentzea aerocolonigenes TaxID=68170 RepID=A0A0F0H1D6_LENAE|nr:hypothetical protein [Lentzea aerocolonigenes]KJK49400.1 hypothetical protein UK23_13955 [Lentzea aerocolonigenes]